MTRSQFGNIADSPAGQYNFLQGGNPDLSPEESDTYAYGLIWTPRFVEGFSLSLDYYSIRLRKAINTVTPEFILNECLDGNDAQCLKVRRGQSGDLWLGSDIASSGHVVSLLDNLAIVEVQGYDITAGYDLDLGDLGTAALKRHPFHYHHVGPAGTGRGAEGGLCGQMGRHVRLSDAGYPQPSARYLADAVASASESQVALHQ